MQRAIRRATVVAATLLLPAAALRPAAAADPTRLPPGGTSEQDLGELAALAAEHPVYLVDGTTLRSAATPLVAFGRVRVVSADGVGGWVALSHVDLERSRDAWATVTAWRALDRHRLQGERLPSVALVDADGQEVDVPSGDGHVLFWPWTPG